MRLVLRPSFFCALLMLLLLFQRANTFAQARLIFGTSSDAYVVMSSNAVAGGNPIYLVVGDATASANPNTITRTTNGRIISNGENNILKWYIGTGTGSYTIPWGYDNNAGSYIPFTFNVTSAGTGNSYVNFSTYRTGANNAAMLPAGVTNDWSSACACNASPWMVDRFWMLDNTAYGVVGNRPTGDLTFYYVDGGAGNPKVFTTGNSLGAADEANLQAESYNNASGLWAGSLWGTDDPTNNFVGSTGAIPAVKLDKWWVLVEKNHPLPVTWLDYSADCSQKEVTIKWSTASEQNADFFTVERSFDGSVFSGIATLPANGNSNTVKKYSFVDTDPYSGKSYYRIRETDFNGATMVSGLMPVNDCSEDLSFFVYPNPATGSSQLNVTVSGVKDSEVLIVVTDMLGREFFSKVTLLTDGQQVIAIDPSHQLAAGVYTIVASSKDEIQKKKIVIQ